MDSPEDSPGTRGTLNNTVFIHFIATFFLNNNFTRHKILEYGEQKSLFSGTK